MSFQDNSITAHKELNTPTPWHPRPNRALQCLFSEGSVVAVSGAHECHQRHPLSIPRNNRFRIHPRPLHRLPNIRRPVTPSLRSCQRIPPAIDRKLFGYWQAWRAVSAVVYVKGGQTDTASLVALVAASRRMPSAHEFRLIPLSAAASAALA